MQTSWRLARSHLSGRRGRTVLLVAAVALAASLVVAVSCAIASTYASFEKNLTQFIGAADARLIHTAGGRFEAARLADVRSWPEVEVATGRLAASLTLVHADRRTDPETGDLLRATPLAVGVDLALEPRFRHRPLTRGRRPTAPDEVMIGPLTAETLRADVGDVLEVQRFGDPMRLTVSGVFERQKLGMLQRPLVYLDIDLLGEASGHAGELTSVYAMVRDGVDVEAFCRRYEPALPDVLALEPAEMVRSGFDREVRASRIAMTIMAILAFLCASFIIVTGLTTGVTERERELALLRCLGAERGLLFRGQLVLGLFFGAVGAAIGLPLGVAFAAALVAFFREYLGAGLVVNPLGVALALSGSLVAGLIGGLYPAFAAARVTPLAALTVTARPVRRGAVVALVVTALALLGVQLALTRLPTVDARYWGYATAGLPALIVGWFLLAVPVLGLVAVVLGPPLARVLGLPADLLRGSILRTPFRHGFTAGALMVSMAMLVASWAGGTAIQKNWLDRIRFADGFAFRSTGITAAERETIAGVPGVEAICPIGYLPARVVSQRVFGLEGLSPNTVVCVGFDARRFFDMNNVQWVEGDPDTAIAALGTGDGAIVAEQFLIARDVGLGDSITLGVGRATRAFEIVGVVGSAGLDLVTSLFGIRSAYTEYAVSCVFVDFGAVVETFRNPTVYMVQVNLDDALDDEEATRRVTEAVPGVVFRSG